MGPQQSVDLVCTSPLRMTGGNIWGKDKCGRDGLCDKMGGGHDD
jgi:hypothetical protein